MKDLTSASLEIQLLFDDKGAISQNEEGDTILVLLNLQQFKTEKGLSLGPNTLLEVHLPRMLVEEEDVV